MSDNTLVVELREGTGKGAARKLRAAGRIPGVVYGGGRESTSISIDPRLLDRSIQQSEAGINTLFDLTVQGGAAGEKTVLVKDIQRDPLMGQPLHADLYEVDMTQTIEVDVPIHLIGEPVGVVTMGGIMDHALRELKIECLPRAIPDSFDLDVTALELGDSLHVRDIALPDGVELRDDSDLSVVSVVAPKVEEEPVAAEEAEEGAEGAEGEGDEKAEGDGDGEKSSEDKSAEGGD